MSTDAIRLVIFASGAGTNAEHIYLAFRHHPFIRVAAIFTNNARAGVIDRMRHYEIPVELFSSAELMDGTLLKRLEQYGADWIILAGFLKKIPRVLINAYPQRILNIHPALLPRFGGKGMYGMRVHRAVLDAKEKITGISIHYVDDGYDTGPIIFQAAIEIQPDETPESLAQRIHQLEYWFYPQIIENIITTSHCTGSP